MPMTVEARRNILNQIDRLKAMLTIDEEERTGLERVGAPVSNLLLYGVPGCGKSHYITENYTAQVDSDQVERVVFHPDYTYADFIGQIMPESNQGHISYPFQAGPFTRILEKAIHNPHDVFYLIIEEINRGNAPAIFGDIFQLLDRKNGESEYGISNNAISSWIYITNGVGDEPERFQDELPSVKIPKNLAVIATMNTADQNVFTLDTAFKRRWHMKAIPNYFDMDNLSCPATHFIAETGVTWGDFAKAVNDVIIQINKDTFSGEDKRLGAYFVTLEDLGNASLFGEKVLMYLWNDAVKHNRYELFKPRYVTLDEVLEDFARPTVALDVFKIHFPNQQDNGENNEQADGQATE